MTAKLITVLVSVLFAVGAIGGTAVLAQSSLAPSNPGLQTAAAQQAQSEPCAQFKSNLAQRLGVTVDKLDQAYKDTAKDMLDQAVKNGKLTQQQADSLKQKIDSAQGKCFRLGAAVLGARGKQLAEGAMLKVGFDAAARALSLTNDQLKAALKSGKSIADIAKEKNVDLQVVKNAVLSAEKAAIDEGLKNGKLTQQQADNLKTMLNKNADRVLDKLFNAKAQERR